MVSEVYHPYTMLGANQHLASPRDSQPTQRSAPLRPTYADDVPNSSSRIAAPADTPMADAVSRSAAFAALAPRGHTVHPDGQRPPPSPRMRSSDSYQSNSSTSAHYGQPQTLPSSTPSTQSTPTPSANLNSTARSRSPATVKVRSLSHIQSFVQDETNPLSQSRSSTWRPEGADESPQYEISDMPVPDIIEMVAGLLTKITTTNDRQHEHLHRQIPPPDGTAHLSQQTTSVLAFHGKNIPSISILSYLSRIHKYCPTTYEVFLSLLVYFDRMTERVNAGPMQSLRQANQASLERQAAASDGSRHSSVSSTVLTHQSMDARDHATTPPPSGSLGAERQRHPPANPQDTPPSPALPIDSSGSIDPYNLSHFFVVDSFNIHRLVIAGVTCASKFFSDIFYTNSRYAKVRLPFSSIPLFPVTPINRDAVVLQVEHTVPTKHNGGLSGDVTFFLSIAIT